MGIGVLVVGGHGPGRGGDGAVRAQADAGGASCVGRHDACSGATGEIAALNSGSDG